MAVAREGYAVSGVAAGGMVPKVRAAAEAASGGARARIMTGKKKSALGGAMASEKVGSLVSEGAIA